MANCKKDYCKSEAMPPYVMCEPHHIQRAATIKRWKTNNPDMVRAEKDRRQKRQKQKVVDAYGGECACCGETWLPYLQIDHINGGGLTDRKLYGGGQRFYGSLIRRSFPDGLQVLCANCHAAKTARLECVPHIGTR